MNKSCHRGIVPNMLISTLNSVKLRENYLGFFFKFQFGLACDEWRRSQIGSIRTIGTLLVLPVTGYISDRWGRRVALIINAVNTGWLGLVRSFVHSYEWFLVTEVIESTIGAGAYSSCYILGNFVLNINIENNPSASSIISSSYRLH